jgi:signal transduction histidine kinase/CheY-like chemotaxis protein
MTKPLELVISTIIIVIASAIADSFYPGTFFILTTFSFLFIILLLIVTIRNKFNTNLDLASIENAHSQKMQALGQLSSAIAHDFNNILTAIIGYSDILLEKHKKDDPSHKVANHIKQSASRAANLVRQLLTFSKKSEIQPTYVEVNNTIRNLSSLMGQLMGNSTTISIDCSNTNMSVLVDITQFEQVIINLAVNAKDAMAEQGQIKIKTAIVNVDKEFNTQKYFTPSKKIDMELGKYVRISISDTGTGIDEKILKKIFEPFFSTKDQSGTGLGLATVFQIVEKMGGYIFVKTEKNKGTTFHIYLKQIDEEEIRESETQTINAEDKPNTDLLSYNILVVEDEDPVRLFSVLALKNAGYNVEATNGAEDALVLIKQDKKIFDLIITDISLGNMDGISLAKELKSFLPNLQTIFTSGYDKETITGIDMPSSTFLSKPYSLKELIETTEETLKQIPNKSI